MSAVKGTQVSNSGALDRSGTGDERLASIVVIDRRPLLRECFVRSLTSLLGQSVISFPSVEHWIEASDGVSASVVLFCAGAGSSQMETHQEIALLMQSASHPSVIVVSDEDDSDQIAKMLGEGVRGYIPTSAPLGEAVAAIGLVNAGGIFVPASSFIVLRRSTAAPGVAKSAPNGVLLTPRQLAVLKALGQGKPNKIIAYELCMAESTVKVHVRTIMKKFGATNRTHLAFLANQRARADAKSGLRQDAKTAQNGMHGRRPAADALLEVQAA